MCNITGNSSSGLNSDTYNNESISVAAIVWQSMTMCIIFLVSLFDNGILCGVFAKNTHLFNDISHRFLINMVICDLAITILIMPFVIYTAIHQEWRFGHVWCQIEAYMNVTLLLVTIITLTLVSFDRYFIIVHPFRYQRLFAHRNGSWVVLILWICALIIAFPPLVGWGKYDFQLPKASCTLVFNMEQTQLGYTAVISIIVCLFPLCVITWSYGNIAVVAYRHSKRWGKIVPLKKVDAKFRKSRQCTDFKAAKTIFLIASAFLICWLPYYVVCMGYSFNNYVPRTLDTMATWFAFSTCAVNPAVYGLLDKRMKTLLWKLLGCHQRQQQGSDRASETQINIEEAL